MSELSKVIVFQLGNEEYAIPIEFVISIEKTDGITPIPQLPNYVKGITKVRGELIPVIDLENILYNRFIQENEATRMIVLETEDLAIGVIVADAKEIINIPAESIKQLGLQAYHKTAYFTGVANLDTRLISMIDPNILVSSLDGIKEIEEFMQSQKA